MEENREENREEMPVESATGEETSELQAEALESEPAAQQSEPKRRRQEKVGLVTSDKMQKTVVVRVERQVRHPKYKRYIRRRTKFMAHDELGAHIGDTVRIIETRPLSARKRWRVVEIIQKAS
jgi:small subunit ribosomal protein S17